MPKFLIERSVPGVGDMSPQQLHGISAQSNGVLHDMQRNGTPIQWIHSYVTDDALNCVYVAPNEEVIREHARVGGFPCNRVTEVDSMIDPTTGE
jgi:hypothetical protein